MESALVYKANALVEASYRLSLYEQRIILACIAQVRRDEPLSDQQVYTVRAREIAEMSGTKVGTAYQNLKAASERLFERRVTLREAPNGEGPIKVRLTRWVQTVEYQDSEGLISLRFGTDMVPYLSQLTEQFTRYVLTDVAKMTSTHAIRLYELLVQWRESGERKVEVEWLREALQIEGRYGNIRDLKRRVIQPAVDQINEHSPLWVTWDQKKTGRRVTHLAFRFGEKERPGTRVQAQRAARAVRRMTDKEIAAAARPGETWDQVRARLAREGQAA